MRNYDSMNDVICRCLCRDFPDVEGRVPALHVHHWTPWSHGQRRASPQSSWDFALGPWAKTAKAKGGMGIFGLCAPLSLKRLSTVAAGRCHDGGDRFRRFSQETATCDPSGGVHART